MLRVPASELKTYRFPLCACKCQAVIELGVSECEAICPHKFDSEGKALESIRKPA